MKPKYSDINLTTGIFSSGIYNIKAVPREWLNAPVLKDFNSNTVTAAITLIGGKTWFELELTPDSYEFDEKPKSNKGSDYFDISLQGNINNLTTDILLILETLRSHELVVILTDRQKRKRVAGNRDNGMILRFGINEKSDQGGNQVIALDLTMQNEFASPFYTA
jgi:hypothetical protein